MSRATRWNKYHNPSHKASAIVILIFAGILLSALYVMQVYEDKCERENAAMELATE